MKRLLPFFASLLLTACESKKAKLVTLQKQIKDSLHSIDNAYASNLLIRSVIMKDSFEKEHPDWRRFGLLDDAVKMDTLHYKMSDKEMNRLNHLHFLLRDKYDSLEFEIKKY
jgi:hypothetical protein